MKLSRWILALAVLGAAGIGSAWADRGHVHFGVVIGPTWGPWYYPPPAYYYPPYYPAVVAAPTSPAVYVERGSTAVAAPQQTNYWYYCDSSQSYYPHVKECLAGWQKVVPQPPSQR